MNIIKILHLILAFISGILLISYGGVDDSPGAQGIGLLTTVGSIFITVHMFLLENSTKKLEK